jgi:hypothetical protein
VELYACQHYRLPGPLTQTRLMRGFGVRLFGRTSDSHDRDQPHKRIDRHLRGGKLACFNLYFPEGGRSRNVGLQNIGLFGIGPSGPERRNHLADIKSVLHALGIMGTLNLLSPNNR